MANPQVEDGYTKVANELLEAIYKVSLSDYEHRIFWFIVRKTYGYKKKVDWIAQKQIVDETGIYKSHVSRTIKKLFKKNMIVKEVKKIGIQKDYDQWKLPKQVTNKKLPIEVSEVTNTGNTVTQTGNKKLPKQADTKEIKETIQKKTIQNKDSDSYKLSEYLYEKILENNPEHKEPSFIEWAKHIDKMIRIDKRDPGKIRAVIDWCQKDNFWYKNILSTQKLREKFDQLILNMGKNKKEDWKDF